MWQWGSRVRVLEKRVRECDHLVSIAAGNLVHHVVVANARSFEKCRVIILQLTLQCDVSCDWRLLGWTLYGLSASVRATLVAMTSARTRGMRTTHFRTCNTHWFTTQNIEIKCDISINHDINMYTSRQCEHASHTHTHSAINEIHTSVSKLESCIYAMTLKSYVSGVDHKIRNVDWCFNLNGHRNTHKTADGFYLSTWYLYKHSRTRTALK